MRNKPGTWFKSREKSTAHHPSCDDIVFRYRRLDGTEDPGVSSLFRVAFGTRFQVLLGQTNEITLTFVDGSTDQELFHKYKLNFKDRPDPGIAFYRYPVNSRVQLSFLVPAPKEWHNPLKELIGLFLTHYDLYYSDISVELHSLCGLKGPEDEIFESLLAQLDKKDVKGAIEMTILYQEKYGFFEQIWNLAQHLSKIIAEEKPAISIDARDLYKLYSNISEKNPHYLEAQEQLMPHVLSREVTASNKFESLEEKFRLALVCKDSRLADRLYTELCGLAFSEKPIVENVSGDYECLKQMAFHMRSMQEEVNKLKRANEDLRSQLARKESVEPELKKGGANDSEKAPWSPKTFRERGAEEVKDNSNNLDVSQVTLEMPK